MQENSFMTPEGPQEEPPMAPGGRNKPPFFHFTINTVITIILLAGLIVLYLLVFRFHRPKEEKPAPAPKSGRSLSIVFVNTDTLNARYEFVKVLRRDLEGTGNRMQNEILGEQAQLERDYNAFQKQVAANALPEAKAQSVYEDLMMRQQKLMEKKDKYTQMISEQELNMNLRLLDTIDSFLKRFNQKHGYDYILVSKKAGDLLIANDSLDITPMVLEELNREYLEHKK
jgi:outer membrane protein